MQYASKYKKHLITGKKGEILMSFHEGVGVPNEKALKEAGLTEQYFLDSRTYGKYFAKIEDAPSSWLNDDNRLLAAALEAENTYKIPVAGLEKRVIADRLQEVKSVMRIAEMTLEELDKRQESPYEFYLKQSKMLKGKKIDVNPEDQELQALRNKARGLKIAQASSMKKETLIARIAEKEKEIQEAGNS